MHTVSETMSARCAFAATYQALLKKKKRHKVKMPCASVLKCQYLTSVVNVWKREFDITKICFLNASASQNLYIELTLFNISHGQDSSFLSANKENLQKNKSAPAFLKLC